MTDNKYQKFISNLIIYGLIFSTGLVIGFAYSYAYFMVISISLVFVVFFCACYYVEYKTALRRVMSLVKAEVLFLQQKKAVMSHVMNKELADKALRNVNMKIAIQNASKEGISPDESLKKIEESNAMINSLVNQEFQRLVQKK